VNSVRCGYKKSLFNHDIMRYPHDSFQGNHTITGRALSLTYSDDIIQFHPDLREEYLYIKSHYKRIGLIHTENIIWDTSVNTIKDFKSFDISLFFFDPEIHKIRSNIDWLETASYINNKNNFITEARKMGVPTPLTFCFANKSEIVSMDQFPYPCFLKKSVSAGGVGVFYCQDIEALERELRDFDDDVALQVQAAIDPKYTLNIQYIGCTDGLKRVAITEQLTDDHAYVGSRFPAKYNPWSVTDPMAKWLFDRGMRGIFAFDIVLTEEDGKECFYALECNPRFNSASYYFGTAMKMGLEQWCGIRLNTNKRSLASLDIEDLEYDPSSKSGVILVEWVDRLSSIVGILMAGDTEMQARLYQEMKRRLS